MVGLGDKVKDKISGFNGTVTGISNWLYGCIRVCVQPSIDKDKKVPKADWIDEEQLEIIGKTKKPTAIVVGEIGLGDTVKDSITSFKGVAVCRTVWLGGYSNIIIQPKVGKDGSAPTNYEVEETRLILVKAKTVVRKKKAVPNHGPRSRESSRNMTESR